MFKLNQIKFDKWLKLIKPFQLKNFVHTYLVFSIELIEFTKLQFVLNVDVETINNLFFQAIKVK